MRRVIAVLLLVGCESSEVEVPAPDYDDFREQVYPLLLRDCGFSGCHGDPSRAFAIWGPGRTRLLDPEFCPPGPFDLPTDAEVWRSYQRTRAAGSHVVDDVGDSPLLQKPLVGIEHGGIDAWGTNVWQREDPQWKVLARWIAGEPIGGAP